MFLSLILMPVKSDGRGGDGDWLWIFFLWGGSGFGIGLFVGALLAWITRWKKVARAVAKPTPPSDTK